MRSEAVPIAVERTISWLRVVVMLSGTALFPLVADEPGYVAWLGYWLLGIGWIYTLGVLLFEPYRRFPILASAWLTTLSDIAMTLVWIGATGGGDSPWQVALVVSTVVASVRCRPRDTLLIALVAVLGYTAMLLALGQLPGRVIETAVFVIYLLLGATVCAVIARERLARLASRLALLDLAQEVAQVGSWEWTIADKTLSFSTEMRRIFGVPANVQPTDKRFFAAIHPEDLEAVRRTIEIALASQAPFRIDHRIVTDTGKIRWLHCRGRIVHADDAAPRQLVGSTQDITETKEMQEQLLTARKLASLGTLASGIAHEINNPLAYVATSLAVARRRVSAGPLDADSRTALDGALVTAQDGCRRVAEIVRGLRLFSRADDGGVGAVDLAAIADSALALASHEIGQRARLVREYREAPVVAGSESRLLQVVLNLVVNAAQSIDVSARSGHEVRVRIEPTSDGRVRLEIADTGCGISPDNLPKIFDPFFTTKPPGVGTGLGLSICHGIVRDLGGEIAVQSTVGRGTTFTVLLPVAPVAMPVAAARDAEPPANALRRLRVLVIDDEAQYARSLSLLLGRDHAVTIATDGGRALSLLCEGEAFDVVLCDLMMPGMSGMDLYEALASIDPSTVNRLLFLTGGPTTERARAFLQRADVRHLEKSVGLAALECAIRAVTESTPGTASSA